MDVAGVKPMNADQWEHYQDHRAAIRAELEEAAAEESGRPPLAAVPLSAVLPPRPGQCYATMSEGQWDVTLRAFYDVGFVLLELDDAERPVAAYRNPNTRE